MHKIYFNSQNFFLIAAAGIAILLIGVNFKKISAEPPIIEVYPGPGTDTYKSDLYNVDVSDGTNWNSSYTYKFSRKSNTLWHQTSFPSVNFTTFGTTDTVSVKISKLSGSITSIDISPKSKNIPVSISNGTATVQLKPLDKAWVTINGDDANPLFIFADPLKAPVPSGAKYFGPGIHEISPSTTNHYHASDNEIIYLDGGAWVKGTIDVRGASNVQIIGPGILSGELWTAENIQALPFEQATEYTMIRGDWGSINVNLNGVTILNSPFYNFFGGTDSVYNAKVISPWYFSTDGFQSVNSVDQSFAFVGDNVFFPIWAGISNKNLSFTNSFVGNTNNAIFCGGFWGNSSTNNYISFVDNIDIKTYNSDAWVPFGAPLTPTLLQIWVDNNDSSKGYKNQTYQNIRVEGNANAPLMQLKNMVYPWGGAQAYDPPLGNSSNIVLKNITLDGTQKYKSEIKGYNASNIFQDISLENIKINGQTVTSSNLANHFEINSYVSGLSVLPLPSPSPIPSPVPSPTPSPSPSPLPQVQAFFDSFEVSEWNGLWTEDSQNDWFRSAQRAKSGTRSAEVDGPANNAILTSIPINLQGRQNATITFSWFIESNLDSGEYVSFEVSTNGGSTWTEKTRLSGNVNTENVWQNRSITLNNISNLRLRFKGKMSGAEEDANLDIVKVMAY